MKYDSSTREFYIIRAFSRVTGSGPLADKLDDISRRGVLTSLKRFAIAFGIGFIQLINHAFTFSHQDILTYSLNAVLIVCVVSGFLNLKRSEREYKQFTYDFMVKNVSLNDPVILYVTSDQGLYVNTYNRKHLDDMQYIPWESIRSIDIEDLRYPHMIPRNKHNPNGVRRRRLAAAYETPRAFHPDFLAGVKTHKLPLKYPGKKTIHLNQKLPHTGHRLATPASWQEDGQFDRFVSDIQSHIGQTSSDGSF